MFLGCLVPDNMNFDAENFYQEIDEVFNIELPKNVRESWQEYWEWLVIGIVE